MNNEIVASADISFKNLRRLYISALLTIAITVLLSLLLIQYNLNSQLSDSKIINISGKQRMLSQKLTKEILILNFVTDSKNNMKNIDNADEIIRLWTFNQNVLEKGNDSLGFPKEKSKEISVLFAEIKPNFDNIVNASKAFLENMYVSSVEQKRNSESGMGLLFMKERIEYITAPR